MLWFMVLQVVSTLVELIQLRRTSARDKELEILLLRRQLAIYERKHCQPMRLTRGEKLTLVVLAVRLKATTGRTIKQLGDVIRIVKPRTVFRWHRELARRKWTYWQRNRGERPRTDREIERLVVRLARENGWATSALRVNC
jgi:putative transposase